MHIICVDIDKTARESFRQMAADFSEIDSIRLFPDGASALSWIDGHQVDAAFIAMDLPDLHGLELAEQLISADPNIRVIFLTQYNQYALEAFRVGAIGYLLKPYCRQDLKRELDKSLRFMPIREKCVVIQTIPSFSVTVDGIPLRTKHLKALELLALLVDRRERGITSGEATACLWPDKIVSDALFRVTWKRLSDMLGQAGIDWLIASKGRQKYIVADKIECDLYRILDGDAEASSRFAGEYMREYEWAENRNAQLCQMLDVY